MLFSYGSGQQQIDNNEKCKWIAGNIDFRADGAVVRYRAHHPLEHIPGFSRSHWMPPLGKCLCRIAPTAAMVDEFVETTQNTNKTQLLASNYGTCWWLVVCENFIPRNRPSTQLSWKCCRFRCRQQLVLKTCLRVFPTRRPDTADVSATSCDIGFFFLCHMSCRYLIADMPW